MAKNKETDIKVSCPQCYTEHMLNPKTEIYKPVICKNEECQVSFYPYFKEGSLLKEHQDIKDDNDFDILQKAALENSFQHVQVTINGKHDYHSQEAVQENGFLNIKAIKSGNHNASPKSNLENDAVDITQDILFFPDEISENTVYTEGAVTQVLVNRYERDKNARNECISHYGPICCVCDFDFKKRYGDIGAGFIHVHHLVKMSDIKHEYKINPINDLRPLCPNCHAMIHKKNPHYSIEELKEIMLNKK